MTYSKNSLIEASDYNTLRNSVNNLWGTGSGSSGLGQSSTLPAVSESARVSNTEWKSLANRITTMGEHQGSVLTTLPAFNAGDLIEYVQAVETNLSTIANQRGFAAAQGTTSETKTTTTSTWSNSLTFTHTVSFASGDAARYFFNAGGQILIVPSVISTSTGIGTSLFRSLSQLSGTLVLSGIGGKIADTTYTPFTKIGGRSSMASGDYNTNLGYYALTTSFEQAVKITADSTVNASTGYGNYAPGSFITLDIKSNGTQGSNGDTGSVLTFRTIMDEVPNGLPVIGTTQVACYVKPPSNGNITNTWGTVTVTGIVSGS